MNRRELLSAGTAALAFGIRPVFAQAPKEIVIGALFPLTGASGQTGVDAQHAVNTAVDVINSPHDLDLPLGKGAGLPGLGGAKLRVVYADHQSDPQKGRAEAERLITHEKVVALIGTYQSAVAVTVSQTAERYGVPFMSADNSSPTLHRQGLKFFFRAAAHDEMFSAAMFDFFDAMRKKGHKIEALALFHEDTIFGTDSANAQTRLAGERGYKIVADIKYRANSPSLSTEVQKLKAANTDVLMPSSYTTDSILLVKTMSELGYKPKAIVAAKRASVGRVNAMFKARSNKDLNDVTSREFMALVVLADAIDRAKSTDGERIRAALAATVIPGERTIMPWKQIKFDESGQNNDADPVLLQYVNRKLVTIYPFAAATAEPIWNA